MLPLPGKSVEAARGCDLWDEIFNAALLVNPAFNIYRIFDTVPAVFGLTNILEANEVFKSIRYCGMC